MLPMHKPGTAIPMAVGGTHAILVARLRRHLTESVGALNRSERLVHLGRMPEATGCAQRAADLGLKGLLDAISALEG